LLACPSRMGLCLGTRQTGVMLGKSLCIPKPQFPHLQNGHYVLLVLGIELRASCLLYHSNQSASPEHNVFKSSCERQVD
jgi:hypothetical protein